MTLTLRRANVGDAEAMARIMGDPRVYPDLLQLPFADAARWRERLAERVADTVGLLLVAELNGEVVGNAGLDPLGPSLRRRHSMGIGLAVAPSAWGQGVGRALLTALCAQADRWLQVRRLGLTVYADNARAISLYQRFGFVLEGRHQAYAMRDGVFVDALAMARIVPGCDGADGVVPAPPPQPVLPQPLAPVARAAPLAVGIRPAEPADGPAIAAILRQRGVVENLLQTPWASIDEVARRLAQSPSPSCNVVALSDGRIVGNASIFVQPSVRRGHVGALAVFVAAEAQGRGVGDALVRAVLDWADRWVGLLRIELGVYADHAAAIALYRKHGFVVEATERCHSLRDGVYVDSVAMARMHPCPPK